MNQYRVYDNTDETLFKSKDKIDCFVFIFEHIFLESIK